jgi:hypothetical protein
MGGGRESTWDPTGATGWSPARVPDDMQGTLQLADATRWVLSERIGQAGRVGLSVESPRQAVHGSDSKAWFLKSPLRFCLFAYLYTLYSVCLAHFWR